MLWINWNSSARAVSHYDLVFTDWLNCRVRPMQMYTLLEGRALQFAKLSEYFARCKMQRCTQHGSVASSCGYVDRQDYLQESATV